MAEVLCYAIPFFVLLLVVEALSYRHLGDDDHDLKGCGVSDTRTSLAMELGNARGRRGLRGAVRAHADPPARRDQRRGSYGPTTNIRTFDPLRVAFGEHLALLRDARAAHGWCTRAQVLLRPGLAPGRGGRGASAPTRG